MHVFDSQGVCLHMYVTMLLRVDIRMFVLSPLRVPKCVYVIQNVFMSECVPQLRVCR